MTESDAFTLLFHTIEALRRTAVTGDLLADAAQRRGCDSKALWKAIASLEQKGFVRCHHSSAPGDQAEGPSTITPTLAGTRAYLEIILSDYSEARRAAARAIVHSGARSTTSLATAIGVPILAAEHFVDAFRRAKLVGVAGTGPMGLHISYVAPLPRWDDELEFGKRGEPPRPLRRTLHHWEVSFSAYL